MRLDVYLSENKDFKSRNKAAEAIKRGVILVNGKIVDKPSREFDKSKDIVEIVNCDSFVSNGGYKLQKALHEFGVSIQDATCADIGASTGGFTECLLKHGAKRVYAIDVGESQLDETLAKNNKVIILDRFNARLLSVDTLGEKVDIVTADVSFISLTYILKSVSDILTDNGHAIVLVKPQFECGKKFLNKNGIVTDIKARKRAVVDICNFAITVGLAAERVTTAPIRVDKNIEYLLLLRKCDCSRVNINGLPLGADI